MLSTVHGVAHASRTPQLELSLGAAQAATANVGSRAPSSAQLHALDAAPASDANLDAPDAITSATGRHAAAPTVATRKPIVIIVPAPPEAAASSSSPASNASTAPPTVHVDAIPVEKKAPVVEHTAVIIAGSALARSYTPAMYGPQMTAGFAIVRQQWIEVGATLGDMRDPDGARGFNLEVSGSMLWGRGRVRGGIGVQLGRCTIGTLDQLVSGKSASFAGVGGVAAIDLVRGGDQNMNALFFYLEPRIGLQLRTTSSYGRSEIEPWAAALAGLGFRMAL